jgi:hypothetical protein
MYCLMVLVVHYLYFINDDNREVVVAGFQKKEK